MAVQASAVSSAAALGVESTFGIRSLAVYENTSTGETNAI